MFPKHLLTANQAAKELGIPREQLFDIKSLIWVRVNNKIAYAKTAVAAYKSRRERKAA
jgi:hypothetical protein